MNADTTVGAAAVARPSGDCPLCTLVESDGADVVYRDAHWWLGVLPGFDAPGWLALATRRHAEGAAEMNDVEASTFGVRLAEASAGLLAEAKAERVYVMGFGEQVCHWHVLLASRPATVPSHHLRADYFNNVASYRDPDKARDLAQRLKQHLAPSARS